MRLGSLRIIKLRINNGSVGALNSWKVYPPMMFDNRTSQGSLFAPGIIWLNTIGHMFFRED